MKRAQFNFAAALSMLLCIGCIAAWIQTRDDDTHFSVHWRGTRYTLHSVDGRITLAGTKAPDSPRWLCWNSGIPEDLPPSTPDQYRQALRLISRIRNSDVHWIISSDTDQVWYEVTPGSGLDALLRDTRHDLRDPAAASPATSENPSAQSSPPSTSAPFTRDRATRLALLRALEDPNRAFAAHVALVARLGLPRFPAEYEADTKHSFYGLTMNRDPVSHSLHPDSAGSIDLVAAWHDRLDQRIVSVWCGALVQCTALLPLLWLTQPRRTPHTFRRWGFNTAALLSSAALSATVLPSLSFQNGQCMSWLFFNTTRHGQPAESLALLDWNHGTISALWEQADPPTGQFAQSHDIGCAFRSEIARPATAFSYTRVAAPNSEKSGWIIQAPFYAIAIPFALIPAIWLLKTRRATPHPCPECGSPAAQTPGEPPQQSAPIPIHQASPVPLDCPLRASNHHREWISPRTRRPPFSRRIDQLSAHRFS
jgi:hypothetical protein